MWVNWIKAVKWTSQDLIQQLSHSSKRRWFSDAGPQLYWRFPFWLESSCLFLAVNLSLPAFLDRASSKWVVRDLDGSLKLLLLLSLSLSLFLSHLGPSSQKWQPTQRVNAFPPCHHTGRTISATKRRQAPLVLMFDNCPLRHPWIFASLKILDKATDGPELTGKLATKSLINPWASKFPECCALSSEIERQCLGQIMTHPLWQAKPIILSMRWTREGRKRKKEACLGWL